MQVYFKRTLVWPGYITHKFDKKCIYPELQSKIGKNGSIPPRFTLPFPWALPPGKAFQAFFLQKAPMK